ncbi:MAG: UDP-2,3-diacylglucosamine diphosphatase [Xanthomonadales bacterium]|nr:UDP-2,3-diacylglucosamine diphosphatase [Gammaproteobacteria bacterium]MBT8053897.1 UDP-2,3-diacylglucosamine diphosphatase [Gammaproteobacteria bacterium]NND55990.1 UDP-2,3-diacylglucosamine diphosphatase [Xanthomonadales bacterium]NNK52051.1 UDP-2,3-diacylglucosamine diphosphatase [Xanthomonadales bacterium]
MQFTLFFSDLHLEDGAPRRTQWLLDLLAGPARDAETVYILGDLFEFWIGDDALSETARQVATATVALRNHGVRCYFMHGNRDFLLGRQYASEAGLEILPESCVVDLYGTPTLLLHGDTLCTDDVEYQAFRQQSRNPAWQEAMLSLPVDERLQLARSARAASEKHTSSTSMEIMDVNTGAVLDAFRENEVRRMIHGHTHRPARHSVNLDGDQAERFVLADWYTSASYLKVSARGIKSITL